MVTVCALLAFYNEQDILAEAIESLLENDLHIYLIDNGSNDDSVKIAESYLGKGVIGLESVRYHDDKGMEKFDWTALLNLKESLSLRLGYDWYLHTDADEARFGPWDGLNLRESISRVDEQGFEQINFKVFNMRPTNFSDYKPYFRTMDRYSTAAPVDSQQVKCWAFSKKINLAKFGGHRAIKDGSVYPIRFILKHYPLRSEQQIHKKLFQDRFPRFQHKERLKGWHVQYDNFIKDEVKTRWYDSETRFFDLTEERVILKMEALDSLSRTSLFGQRYRYDPIEEGLVELLYRMYCDKYEASPDFQFIMTEVNRYVLHIHSQELGVQDLSHINTLEFRDYIFWSLRFIASHYYLCGRPRLYEFLSRSFQRHNFSH